MTSTYFNISIDNYIATVEFNRPDKANALNAEGWEEFKSIFQDLDQNDEVRVVVLSAQGKHWCAGIDLSLLMSMNKFDKSKGEARRRELVRDFIKGLQRAVSSVEICSKPVIAAIHGGCIGAGLDRASACDIRLSVDDAYFTVKETALGLVADLGTLQRLPKIIPYAHAADMAYTGKHLSGVDAKRIHLVNDSFSDKASMIEAAQKLAENIAQHSPLVIRGIKETLLHARDNTVEDGLKYIANFNAAFLSEDDIQAAFMAKMQKSKPEFLP